MNIIIEKENSGKRLDIFLAEVDENISRSQWQRIIKDNNIQVNGKIEKGNYKIKEGDKIDIKNKKVKEKDKKIDNTKKERKTDFNVEVVAETDDYLIINKPAGLVVHTNRIDKDYTLGDWVIKNYPKIKGVGEEEDRPGIVHRLDKDVSGLMVIAKTQEMFLNLKKQFKERKINKYYKALVHGKMEQDEGRIELPILRSKDTGMFIAQTQEDSEGRKAITEYEVEKKFINYTLLKIKILTGRTHQIRVHLRAIGHSIVGDELYATKDIKKKARKVKINRIWLYAEKLGFEDLSGEKKEFEIDMPEELAEVLGKIK